MFTSCRGIRKKKISTKVVNMHTIKPIDKEEVINSKDSKLIVTVEEHNIIGGLGSAISEINSSIKNSPKQIFIGVNDTYSKAGSYDFLKNKYGLSKNNIVNEILLNL